MDANAWFGIAAVIAALGVTFGQVITALNVRHVVDETRRTAARIEDVHSEVKTGNGRTIARLADLAEGRRVVADVAVDDRTIGEQHSVAMLNEPDTPAPGSKP